MKYILVACWMNQLNSKLDCATSPLLFDFKKRFKKSEASSGCHVQTTSLNTVSSPTRLNTAKTLLWLLAVSWFISFRFVGAVGRRGWRVNKSEGWRKEEERDESKGLHPPRGGKNKKQHNQLVDRWLTGIQEVEKRSWPFPPYRWRQKCTSLWVQRSCASPAGGKIGPKRGRAKWKRQGKERETAQRQTSSCSGQARLMGAGRDVLFLFFSRWGDTAACFARARLRGGAPVQGNLWKAHTHRSGQGGCMLENSGLVLGVDSSLGLLTRLHNPRHVGVALLVHGRLLHLTEEERGRYREGKQEAQKLDKRKLTFSTILS